MREFHGKSVHGGFALGPLFVLQKESPKVRCSSVEDTKEEWLRFQAALEQAAKELQDLLEKTQREVGEEEAAIFEAHKLLLKDEDYLNAIQDRIEQEGVNAEYAVAVIGGQFSERFEKLDNSYMKERSADIRDVSERLIKNLKGQKEKEFLIEKPCILAAEDLSPSQTMGLHKDKILGLITIRGSVSSHTAILARMRNIPALVGTDLDLSALTTGTEAFLDGETGKLILEPDEMVKERARKSLTKEKEQRLLFQELKGKENVTLGGRKIQLLANIGSMEDARAALENDAGGIGLFRSECLYLARDGFPTEEEQFLVYRQILEQMGSKKTVIRTLDIGADKQADYIYMKAEKNPALGCRGIRFSLKRPDIFRTQLSALFRAAVYGNLSILYPMISSTEEMREIRQLTKEVEETLKKRKRSYKIPKQGIMIETPAAAMISSELAELTDFFSIGTNDLTQYTLAVDRQNEEMDAFYDPRHEAVLCLIRLVVKNAKKAGIPVGICGELAADETLLETFLDMGLDELSVAPWEILRLRKRIRELK